MKLQRSLPGRLAALALLSSLIVLAGVWSVGCGDDDVVNPDTSTTGTVMDIDANVYQTVKIGSQWWMAEDLRVKHYRNGDAIPYVTDSTAWVDLISGALCDYDHDTMNVATYGHLYNWYAATDSRHLAPAGWHVPSDAEWKQLEMYLGMGETEANSSGWRGTNEGGRLKESGTTHWTAPNEGATDDVGFTGLPGGFRHANNRFMVLGHDGYYWTTTESGLTLSIYRSLTHADSTVYRSVNNRTYGYSVRCVRD